MEELLSKLYSHLTESFQDNLKSSDLVLMSDCDSLDVLKTFLSLKKSQKDIITLMHKSAISIDELIYISNEGYVNCLNNKFILKGTGLYSNKAFLGLNGIFEYYSINSLDFRNAFISYDSRIFPVVSYSLKPQEKIWCIYLLLLGANSLETCYDTEAFSPSKLETNHKFFETIEKVMADNAIKLGKSITWSTGKDKSFRGLIGNNVDLMKTDLVHKKGNYKYYLNFSRKKNAEYLLDLILDKYNGAERIDANDLFYDSLKELSFMMLTEIGEMRVDINKHIIEILKS